MSSTFHGITPGVASGKPGSFNLRSAASAKPLLIEDDPIMEITWVEQSEAIVPLVVLATPETLWAKTKRYASNTWKYLNTPIGDLWRGNA